MKLKILIILFGLSMFVFGAGLTYSVFHSDAEVNVNQNIAKFVFDANTSDNLELMLDGLVPGDYKEYSFSITNTADYRSEVVLNYQIAIKTFHFMPLDIELYKVTGNQQELVMKCDETYSRNQNNELVCNSSVMEMSNDQDVLDNYRLRVTFPNEYDTEEYANLVDFLDIDIESWQKIEGD